MAAKPVPEPASGPAAPGPADSGPADSVPADSGPAPHERIFVGLDTADVEKAARLAKLQAGAVGGVKIGKEFFTAQGPDGVRLVAGGAPLFLDLKFHDIPNTVAGAVRAAVHLRPKILNVHAAGGRAMMTAAAEAARETAEDLGIERPRVIGVTVLTSLDEAAPREVGQKDRKSTRLNSSH